MGANTRDAPALSGLLLGGRRRRSSLPQLIKQAPNAAAPVVFSDLLFDTPVSGAYTLTCLGGTYTLTGGSAVLTKIDPLRPVLISSTALAIGTSATPGAQSITVPSDAQLVVVQATSYTSGGLTLSLSSSFAGTFTTTTAGDGSDKCHIAYALVSSTGSQTITPTWSSAVTDGPLFFVSFVKNINTSDFLRQALAYNINTQGSTTSTTISSTTRDLVLAMEREGLTTVIPTVMSGFTSAATQGVNNIGGRNQTTDAPGTTTTTLQSSGTEFPGFSAISIKPNVGGAHTLTAQGGSYSLAGQPAILKRSKVIIASSGSYTLTGQNANLVKGRVLTAQGGSYTYTGQSANLLRSKKITATGGAYSITGQQAILSRSKYIIAQGGTYSLTGGSATITWTGGAINYTLICQGGSYTLLGASANINRNRNLTANGGIYSLSGSSVIILRSKYLSASGGSYLYSGQSAVLKRSRLLQAIGGSYNLAGSSAILTKSSAGGYPAEADVRLGVVYGASGEYTGTLDVGKKFRLDIATGNVVMILDGGKVMTL